VITPNTLQKHNVIIPNILQKHHLDNSKYPSETTRENSKYPNLKRKTAQIHSTLLICYTELTPKFGKMIGKVATYQ
jgi:hypothetical protein